MNHPFQKTSNEENNLSYIRTMAMNRVEEMLKKR